jgi:hypothetical protein
LITAPSGARLPRGNVTVLVRPRARPLGRHDHLVGIDAIACREQIAQLCAPLRALPPVQHCAQALAGHRQRLFVQHAQPAQMQHDLRHAAGQEDPHGRMIARPVGQHIDQPRHAPVDRDPFFERWARQPG